MGVHVYIAGGDKQGQDGPHVDGKKTKMNFEHISIRMTKASPTAQIRKTFLM